ncbi:MAG: UDP-N-acetylmuramate dehydrogenase [Flavobacteriaceae bacterium]|nr:UDP-N-acetylmuramate dehydrogenase [Flavobacteriaceae bacterium]NVJ72508.1 UDP-N-acetylmuramate dehydrogenase [Flavobacteriaceae bacterium]
MNLKENISLKELNSFGIDVKASNYLYVQTIDTLKEVLDQDRFKDPFILSGGSNLLLMNDLDRLVIHMGLKGIEVLDETNDEVFVKAMAGEVWHEFVLWCIEHHYGGLENLSLIPGYVGSAPIQNIGAYGVEQGACFNSCEVLDRETNELVTLSKKDCEFGYRDSIFKSKHKNRYIITSVIYKLQKNNHKLHIDYGAIQTVLKVKGIKNPNIKDVSEAVIQIRSEKLPNPKELGNSGSFFKNPIIDKDLLDTLQKTYPEIPHYTQENNQVKLAAGWLIEKAGFKGQRKGNVGSHHKQALVLVNHGNATGKEVYEFAMEIIKKVQEQFAITLEPEVRIIK